MRSALGLVKCVDHGINNTLERAPIALVWAMFNPCESFPLQLVDYPQVFVPVRFSSGTFNGVTCLEELTDFFGRLETLELMLLSQS